MRAVAVFGLALAIAAALVPATADAAGLIAAYDRYETGKGFEIGLVNVSTGATVPVPATVNTTDDELHPALSADGRYLVFTRMNSTWPAARTSTSSRSRIRGRRS